MGYTCPVCGYTNLSELPYKEAGGDSFEVCPSCDFQFGYSDGEEGISYEQWRAKWIEGGMIWGSNGIPPPSGWNPREQLRNLERQEAKFEAVRVAQAIVNREIELVPGCRTIQRPLDGLDLRMDSDFTIFVAVDSEADELPIGDERRHWNPDALEKYDIRLRKLESSYRPSVERACRAVIARLG